MGWTQTGVRGGLGLSHCPLCSPLGNGEAGMGLRVDVLQERVMSEMPTSMGKELGRPSYSLPAKAGMALEGWVGGGARTDAQL